jgi:hypothetical protein
MRSGSASGRRATIEGLSTAVSIDSSVAAPASAVAGVLPRPGAPARTRWWLEALTIVWLGWVYDATTNLAPLRMGAALGHARGILSLEQTIGIAPERSLDTWLAGHQTLGLVLSDYYDNAHFVVTLGLLGWLWWARADVFRGLRNSLILINLLGFIVFWRYPVAPPRMLDGFTDVVASTHAIGSWHDGALASHANQLAAMPSLHIAWAVWCTLAVWQVSTRVWVRALAVFYPCLTGFAVVSTGNHFVLDIVGGVLVTLAAFAIVRLLSARRRGALPATA